VRLIDAGADVSRDDRVMRRRGVASDELDGGLATRRSVACHPTQVEFLNAQPEIVGVEVTGSGDVSDRKVRVDAGYSHRSSSSRTYAASRPLRLPPLARRQSCVNVVSRRQVTGDGPAQKG